MSTVKAWCVKSPHNDYFLWTCSILKIASQRVFSENKTKSGKWLEAEKAGFSIVQVEIKEVSND